MVADQLPAKKSEQKEMTGIRVLVAACLLIDIFAGMVAGLLAGLVLDIQWLPGQSLKILFDFELADVPLLNSLGGGLIGLFCGIICFVILLRNSLFCSDSKNAKQLPAISIAWMACLMMIISLVSFTVNWILVTDYVDVFMRSNRFFDLLKYWLAIYLLLGAIAGIINGGGIYTAHLFCRSRRLQNEDVQN